MYYLKRTKGIWTVLLPVFFQLLFSCNPAQKAPSRPNIIFLLCDDLRWDAMGWMGNKHTLTPNLDMLAGKGVVFENAYHTSPICKPSRSTIMLGQYLGTHGCGFDHPTRYTITEAEFAHRSQARRLRWDVPQAAMTLGRPTTAKGAGTRKGAVTRGTISGLRPGTTS